MFTVIETWMLKNIKIGVGICTLHCDFRIEFRIKKAVAICIALIDRIPTSL